MTNNSAFAPQDGWLKTYYFSRAAFSAAWVVAAFTLGAQPALAAVLLVIYPAWDAAANYVDASRNGGLARNRSQAINVAVSVLTTIAVVISLQTGMNAVLGVFGAWAILSGLLQLATGITRWKSGAQWAMVLSGAQSALAGVFFIIQSRTPTVPSIATIAGYAALGAVYFLMSAVWLAVKERRAGKALAS
jgi:uncharacterized membrane protein HdeD (DUF308 family)